MPIRNWKNYCQYLHGYHGTKNRSNSNFFLAYVLIDVGNIVDTERTMKNISNAGILLKYAANRYMTHLQNMPVSDGSSGKNGIIFMKQVTLEYLLSYT